MNSIYFSPLRKLKYMKYKLFKSFDYGPLSSAFFLCFWEIKFSFFFNYEIIILRDNTQVSN